MTTKDYWNEQLSNSNIDQAISQGTNNWIHNQALLHFEDIKGKTLLDLGCGQGHASVFFARLGAYVISIDFSEVAVSNLNKYCKDNNIENIQAICMQAQDINKLKQVDFVFGSYILHHIEPFSNFVITLQSVVKNNGKCFFIENNSTSNMLMWFRDHLTGRLWIPKHSDGQEYPLSPDEVDILKKYFIVEQEIPYMHFFRMLSSYLFKKKFFKQLVWLDSLAFRIKSLRKYSYKQILRLTKSNQYCNQN
jgi:2-polyprenyl-3-methyl-5-hydroxy-6-metoxy-1,4-benzoquinol methylase